MPVDPKALLKGLKPVLKQLNADLLKRGKDSSVEKAMRVSWEKERRESRTAAAFPLWRRRRCEQVAIAWVLSVVFVRTLEDRGFMPRVRIGASGQTDSEAQFTTLAPFLTARDYLLTVFRELSQFPGVREVFDERHNPVWVLAPSAAGAQALLDFFQKDGKAGSAPRFDGEDTRFLGDLYQNLSEDVRKRFALLQTPEFVEEFILEQTLDPAIREFGLKEVKLIDPTCGSGHFLLGAFHRLLAAWTKLEPGVDRQVLAQRTIAQIHGVDLNPYAVAIARFRLTLEFMQAVGLTRLDRTPPLRLNLVVADSLYRQSQLALETPGEARFAWGSRLFAFMDEREAMRVLRSGSYHAVVGNPPYIKESDGRKRRHLLDHYRSAFAQFTLSAPFTERFFELAVPSGCVGMINANAFAKRDFGKVLIEEILPHFDIQKMIDTAGAFIPGHSTPTLLLFGRNRSRSDEPVVAVLGKSGEAREPAVPSQGPVWLEIREAHAGVGFDGRHVSTEAIPRSEFGRHPWVLAGGGARELKSRLDAGRSRLADLMEDIGFSVIIGQDEVYLRRKGMRAVSQLPRVECVFGDSIRDWTINPSAEALRPFNWPEMDVIGDVGLLNTLWPWKRLLETRVVSGSTNMKAAGKTWYELRRLSRRKHKRDLSIAFAFVATHNHFALDHGRRIFKQTAPVIKLPESYDEADHLALLGWLNSSVVGFWCRLVMFLKGVQSTTQWENRLEYSGTLLKECPVPSHHDLRAAILPLVEQLDAAASESQKHTPQKVLERAGPSGASLRKLEESARHQLELLHLRMVSIQEEIDWRAYRLVGLPTITSDSVDSVVQPVAPEHRPFEVRLARGLDEDISAQIWFKRHKRTPPSDVGGPLADLYRRRVALIDQTKELQLLETPETKRRWSPRDYDAEFRTAYREWLLDRIEKLFEDDPTPTPLSARQIAAEVRRDPKAMAVAEVYTDETAPDIESLISDLVRAESVPFLAAWRYSTTGLENYAEWEKTWDLQRREDAGEEVGKIPVPDKYKTGDFRKAEYWSHRGALDVPEERFVSYPKAEPDHDETPLVGWAGWDHRQKATALSGIYQRRKTEESWPEARLVPLLAGVEELVPWVLQWHNEPDPNFGGQRVGDMFRDYVEGQLHELGVSRQDLQDWRPPEKPKKKGKTKAPPLDPDAVLDAVQRLQANGEVSVAQLATELDTSQARVNKAIKTCVDAGQLVKTSGRPLKYRLA